ncbi:aminoglycoside phosphotransferase family protein [Solwaraspora sp. WMMD792]|uniref:aminoglycoside phosphotransferase family protein n=1 Tax=Solwaraspora sp. WMMD792 TaxID=3016099 RepID=UPI0024171A3F|nr:aminoglycoside phosphotransferase family protein [Solwaraspora sp. WMMD792]MDG4770945.1 aminoglycoside phosphotransferase family protein [Solwaraspora sp. WMMD792]
MDDRRWRDPQWLARVRDWVDDRLGELGMTRTGPAVQPHIYPWSTVLRVPTDAGDVWFKANTESLRQEAAVVTRIAARRPDAVPPLLAADLDTGWMLMADAGETLRVVTQREQSLDRWYDVLPLYAAVQLDLADDVDDLLALGVPDRRLATLPQAYERIIGAVGAERRFRDAAPMVADLCAELAQYGLPELLQHDDLHDAQVFVRDGRHLIMDWGDACVSHPFLTLSVTLEGGLAWGLADVRDSVDTAPFRDAYLAPYAERFTGDLVAATRVAMRLGWVCRAVNGHVPGDDKQTLTRLRMFLDGRP